MSHLRRADRIVVWTLVAAWVACFVLTLHSGFAAKRFPPVGVRRDPAGGHPILITVRPDVDRLEADILLGDTLIRLGDTDLRGFGAPAFYAHYVAQARHRDPLTVVFERKGQRHVTLLPRAVPVATWPFLLVSIGFFSVALVVRFRAPPSPLRSVASEALLLVAIGCACPLTGGVTINHAGLALGGLVWSLQFPMCLNALLRFPSHPPTAAHRWRRVPWLFAVMGPLGVSSVAGFPLGRPLGIALQQLALLSYFVVTSLAVAGLYRRADPILRRQIRWVAFGFGAALAPPISLLALVLFERVLFGASTGFYPWLFASYASGVLIPISMLIAIRRYNLFDVDRLISATTTYNAFLLALLALGLAAMSPFEAWASTALGIDSRVARVGLAFVLAAAGIPTARWLRCRIERLLFPERIDLQRSLLALLRSLDTQRAAPELANWVGKELVRLLRPKSCVFYARVSREELEALFVDGSPMPPSLAAAGPVVATLAQRARPLSLGARGRRSDSAGLGAFERAALDALSAEVVVPIVHGDQLAAFFCLGPKRSGDVYTPTDLAHLASLAQACANVLQRVEQEARAATQPAVFRHDGGLWTIAYAGKEVRLRDLRGLHYLATLLREPGREFHASDVVRSGRGPSFAPSLDETLEIARGLGDAGEPLDARARVAYKARLAEIDDEIAESERHNDLGALERSREEREALLSELGAAARGGRAGSEAERARVTVTKAIKAALDRIASSHPELGAHLQATVRRGYFCAYVPDPRSKIEWEA